MSRPLPGCHAPVAFQIQPTFSGDGHLWRARANPSQARQVCLRDSHGSADVADGLAEDAPVACQTARLGLRAMQDPSAGPSSAGGALRSHSSARRSPRKRPKSPSSTGSGGCRPSWGTPKTRQPLPPAIRSTVSRAFAGFLAILRLPMAPYCSHFCERCGSCSARIRATGSPYKFTGVHVHSPLHEVRVRLRTRHWMRSRRRRDAGPSECDWPPPAPVLCCAGPSRTSSLCGSATCTRC